MRAGPTSLVPDDRCSPMVFKRTKRPGCWDGCGISSPAAEPRRRSVKANVAMQRCRRCLLPEAVPGSAFDAHGVCAFCRDYRPEHDAEAEVARDVRRRDLEATLESVKSKAGYQALVCLSGGKDSLYLLHRLTVDHGLRVLAFTVDANLPDVAWRSIRRTVEKLAVDHLIYRPPPAFYRKLFAYLLRHQEQRG